MLHFFFFNDTATTEIYTLSLHDALPISYRAGHPARAAVASRVEAVYHRGLHADRQRVPRVSALVPGCAVVTGGGSGLRSEEHTSELQSQSNLVCRLLLSKKK